MQSTDHNRISLGTFYIAKSNMYDFTISRNVTLLCIVIDIALNWTISPFFLPLSRVCLRHLMMLSKKNERIAHRREVFKWNWNLIKCMKNGHLEINWKLEDIFQIGRKSLIQFTTLYFFFANFRLKVLF